jgi:molybdopterin-binding protein
MGIDRRVRRANPRRDVALSAASQSAHSSRAQRALRPRARNPRGRSAVRPLDTRRAIGYNSCMRLSARNRLVGKIVDLKLGDIMAHVVVEVGEHQIESVITRRSADELKLKVGDTVAAVIKSTEVLLQKA